MNFTQNYWGQRDIINKIIILTTQGTYTIHAVIPKKYQKHPSTTILKHVSVLAKVKKLPYGCLHNMTPHGAYSIIIRVYTMTISDPSHEKND